MKIKTLLKRVGEFVNPPPLPGDPGSMPSLRDYPVARRPASAGRAGRTRLMATTLTVAVGAAVLATSATGAAASSKQPAPAPTVTTRQGTLTDGATWIIEKPANWNGTVLLYSHGLVPPGQENPAQVATDPLTEAELLRQGYALAGSSYAGTGFVVEEAQRDQTAVLDLFDVTFGAPTSTLAWGQSLGGLLSLELAERDPERIDGVLSICGVVGGSVNLWNSYLDVLFTAKTLIAPDAPIELTNVGDPFANIDALVAALDAAQQTPDGRARIALAAAMGNFPGWTDADAPEPDRDDVATQERNQYETMRDTTALLGLALRADMEARAGGNPSSNVGVDYAALLRGSSGRREVKALYASAGLDLRDDLATLASAPRIDADQAALSYNVENATLEGGLDGVPVLTLHNVADPLVPVQHEQALSRGVRAAGDRALLRQVYVDRAGHCAMSPAETTAALETLIDRVAVGEWPRTSPFTMNQRATALGPEMNAHLDDATGAPVPTPPAFTRFSPSPFLRR